MTAETLPQFQLHRQVPRFMCRRMEHSAPKPPQPIVLTHTEILFILSGLLLAMLLAALDQTIVATAMPTIGREFGDTEQLPWIVTAYLLAATAVTPLYGKLSDIHGRRIIMLIAIAIFLIGSVFCAFATSLPMLAVARAVQGAGGGGLISLAQTIIGDIFQPRERARYQVYIATVFILSSIAGPILGGFLAEHAHWSAIFWINLPLGILAFLLANRQLKRIPRHERPHKLDVIGAVLLVAATTSLLVGLNWGGVRYAWMSSEIAGTFAAALLLWAAFVWRLLRADEPLIPLTLLSNKTMLGATLAASSSMGALIGLTVFMPVYFEVVQGVSATQSGIALLPLMVGTVIGATLSSRAMIHFSHYKFVPLLALCVSLAAAGLLAVCPVGLAFSAICALLGCISIGLGTVLSIATVSIQNVVAPHQLGTALATSNLFRQLGGALSVAICGSIIAAAGIGAVGHMHIDRSAIGAENLASLIGAYRYIFIVTAIGAFCAILSLFLVEERPLKSAGDKQLAPVGE
jgi:EmrB/QacA subfamily drug resistance transporter